MMTIFLSATHTSGKLFFIVIRTFLTTCFALTLSNTIVAQGYTTPFDLPAFIGAEQYSAASDTTPGNRIEDPLNNCTYYGLDVDVSDSDNLCSIVYTAPNEEVNYSIGLAGNFFDLHVQVASKFADKRAKISVDGKQVAVAHSSGLGWNTYEEVVIPNISIPDQSTLGVTFLDGRINYRGIDIRSAANPPLPPEPAIAQGFSGRFAVPGRISAEKYFSAPIESSPNNKIGGELVNCDYYGLDVDVADASESGCAVVLTTAGEQVVYRVGEAGNAYDLNLRIASSRTGQRISIAVNGVNAGTVSASGLGKDQWETVSLKGINVPTNANILVSFLDGDVSLNYIDFTESVSPRFIQLPGKILPEFFTQYRDTSTEQLGDCRSKGEVDFGKDPNSIYDACKLVHTIKKEWLDYPVLVREAGQYDFTVKLSSKSPDKRVRLFYNDRNIGTVKLKGGDPSWDIEETFALENITLPEGPGKLRVFFISGYTHFIDIDVKRSLPIVRQGRQITPLDEAEVAHFSVLSDASLVSDGSERERNGKRRFLGSLGADAVTYKGYQYAVFYSDKDRNLPKEQSYAKVIIARRKLGAGVWEYSELQGYKNFSDDAHNFASIGISRGDGVIHIAFDHHGRKTLNYAHTTVGAADNPESLPWDNTVFSLLPNLGRSQTEIGSVTYPAFIPFANGNLALYFRHGGSSGGEMTVARYDANLHSWSFVRRFSTGAGTFKGNTTNRGPYNGGLLTDLFGNLRIGWIFREKPISCGPGTHIFYCNHGLYYAESPDEGRTWYNAAGHLIADTDRNEKVSIDNIGPEVVYIPTSLAPSNVAISSAIDPLSNDMHFMLRHRTRDKTGIESMHHYVGTKQGAWTGGPSNFSGSRVKLAFQGDVLFAFVLGNPSAIHYATRQNKFNDWSAITMPKVGTQGAAMRIAGGRIGWDTGSLHEGIISLMWHHESEDKEAGLAAPIYAIDLKIAVPATTLQE